ncbi:hypothetical protein QF117_19235 [Vibrio sp. YMD68]|uniref:hypothetical protein n=1 Tax=Vibrio sp. YMD68 TaxID=3042300 RepID=UPI00249A45B2|nr:hypothetical protein [Vibrio sp. YMD68]WGW00005.1 hypothetical protein QF117_19235 [Vibrio sp. YMD68]
MDKDVTVFELIRDNQVVKEANSNDFNNYDGEYNASGNQSLDELPSFKISSTNPIINSAFMGFSNGDKIRVTIIKDGQSHIIHEGEFGSKRISTAKNDEFINLELESYHSCIQLILKDFGKKISFKDISFEEFVTSLFLAAKVDIKVNICPELAKLNVNGFSYSTNAFRIFKQVCFMHEASVKFNADNSISIELRDNQLKKIRRQTPLPINKEDMLSFSSNETIMPR